MTLIPTPIIAGLLTVLIVFQAVTPLWQAVILATVGGAFAAGLTLYGQLLIQKRNRRAELQKTGDQTYADLGHVVLELTDKERGRLEEGLQTVTARLEQVHAKELQFLQGQVTYRGNLEVQARNRTHRALAEVQRCVMTIRAHEEQMREAEVPFESFTFKSYDDIIGDDKIPTIPEAP